MQTFVNNIDELLKLYAPDIPDDQDVYDDYIADVVTKALSTVNNHYQHFQSELELNNQEISPIVTVTEPDHTFLVQYVPHSNNNDREQSIRVVQLDNVKCNFPLFMNKKEWFQND